MALQAGPVSSSKGDWFTRTCRHRGHALTIDQNRQSSMRQFFNAGLPGQFKLVEVTAPTPVFYKNRYGIIVSSGWLFHDSHVAPSAGLPQVDDDGISWQRRS